MLCNIFKTAIKARSLLAAPRLLVSAVPRRSYYPDGQLMQREEGDYFADPVMVAERIVRLVALHDNVTDPSSVTLNSTFEELGLNPLDLCEIFLQTEREFDVEISEEDCESFVTVNDLVENLSRNFYTK